MNKTGNIILAIIVILLIIGGIYWMRDKDDDDTVIVVPGPTSTVTVTPTPTPTFTAVPASNATTTVTGEYVCLPHRNTSGPTTMECAFGIRADNGNNYGLDLSGIGIMGSGVATGDRIRIQGKFATTTSTGNTILFLNSYPRKNSISSDA